MAALSASVMASRQDDDKILAMSYNICWGCVTPDTRDSTGRPLAQICINETQGITQSICLTNVAKVFDEVQNEVGQQLDLVGTQESAKWNELIMKSAALLTMNYVHHRTTTYAGFDIEFLSLYNGKKFTLDALKYGNLDSTNRDGRPYHILFLTHKRTQNKYIFINIHSGHHFGATELSKVLSQNINMVYKTKQDNSNITIHSHLYEQYKQTYDFATELLKNDYSIIFMGDTNDHDNTNLWEGFTPFNEPYNINKNLSSKGIKPPKTYCDTKLTNTHELVGDYILIDDGLEFNINNTIPLYSLKNIKTPSSDHLPIYAIINEKPPLRQSLQDSLQPSQQPSQQPSMEYDGIKNGGSLQKSIKLKKFKKSMKFKKSKKSKKLKKSKRSYKTKRK